MFIGCKEKSATELYVKSRTNVVKVKDKVCEVMTEEPFISNYSDVYFYQYDATKLLNNHLLSYNFLSDYNYPQNI